MAMSQGDPDLSYALVLLGIVELGFIWDWNIGSIEKNLRISVAECDE